MTMKKIRKVISFSLMFVCLSAVLTACGNFSGEDLFDLPDTSEIKTYTNPIASVLRDGETWQNYGIGDPFVMRYDGKYYLYPSTKDGSTQIKCWSSEDLVNWTYEGVCCSDETCTGAYAPEVCYYNGMFYMYSSPAGKGHYIDGELMIDYTDVNEPWLQGMVGFRCAAAASFDNLKVTALSTQ